MSTNQKTYKELKRMGRPELASLYLTELSKFKIMFKNKKTKKTYENYVNERFDYVKLILSVLNDKREKDKHNNPKKR